MFNRKRLDRERLEIYLVHLLLVYRPLLLISGVLLLAYAVATLIRSFLAGSLLLILAVFPLLLGFSYPVVLFTARLGAWLAMLGRKE